MTFSSLPADSPEQEWKEKTHTVDKSGFVQSGVGSWKRLFRSFAPLNLFSVAAEDCGISIKAKLVRRQNGIWKEQCEPRSDYDWFATCLPKHCTLKVNNMEAMLYRGIWFLSLFFFYFYTKEWKHSENDSIFMQKIKNK